jgi:hypothetical protein
VPVPSSALAEKISTKFRRSVESLAAADGIPWASFGKDDRKIDGVLSVCRINFLFIFWQSRR